MNLAGFGRCNAVPDADVGMEQQKLAGKSEGKRQPEGAVTHAKSAHATAVRSTVPTVLLGDMFMVCNTLSGILATSVGRIPHK